MSILDRIVWGTDDWIGLGIVVGVMSAMWFSGFLIGLWKERRRIANGEFVEVIDADCITQEDMIQEVVKWNGEHPDQFEASQHQDPAVYQAMHNMDTVSKVPM